MENKNNSVDFNNDTHKNDSDNKNKNRTYKDQIHTQAVIERIFKIEDFDIQNPETYNSDKDFDLEGHFNFAKKMIFNIPGAYSSIDAGLPWFSYWILNTLNICSKNQYSLNHDLKLKFVKYLKELQHIDGGFCGYAGGMPHIVSNYAAVMSIASLGIKEGYEIIDCKKMRNFLIKMKNNNFENKIGSKFDKTGSFLIELDKDNNCSNFSANWPGSFQMHQNGESDLRATYCGLTVAYILNLLDEELLEGVVDNIKKCQTFEGGLGPEPFCEAHGGYSYCGIATLTLINKLNEIDMDRFLLWIVNKQMTIEGGFQGRTNKLVDSCYSFWQASVFNMLIMNGNEHKYSYDTELLYDQLSLQAYILLACQYKDGGLIDKPSKRPDLFHTNYASAGLALSQKSIVPELSVSLSLSETLEFDEINPIFCINNECVLNTRDYFYKLSK